MVKRVLLDVAEGNLETGFRITLRIGESSKPYHLEQQGQFPPAPQLLTALRQWQQEYQGWGDSHRWRAIEVPPQVIQVSTLESLQQSEKDFLNVFLKWVETPEFLKLHLTIARQVGDQETARLILHTTDSTLQHLPWHLWSLFTNHCQGLDLTLSAGHAPLVRPIRGPVRALVIIGGAENLDTNPDLQALKRLPNCNSVLLFQPTLKELRARLHDERWDILYFAGHSNSSEDHSQCRIYVNEVEFFSPEGLYNALKMAIAKGLQLAIFNSCQGLGIAKQLADLGLPRTIVMREPVLDSVAHAFAKYFLGALSSGHNSDRALRLARQRLAEEVETDRTSPCPCASWMPVVWQNPVVPPLIWPKRNLLLSAAGGVIVTSILAAIGLSFGLNSWHQHKFESASSQGEQIFWEPKQASQTKRDAARAYAQGNFDQAQQLFQEARKAQPNDPEIVIYLNNLLSLLQPQRPSVTIAVSLPLIPLPAIAQEMLRGIAQAQQEVNAKGGIPMATNSPNSPNSPDSPNSNSPKRLLRILLVDDAHQPTQAADFASYLGRQANILGVVGHYSSGVALEAGREYDRAQLPAIFPTATSVDLSDKQKSDYTFRTAANDATAGQSLADYLHNRKIQRIIAYYDPNNNYSRSLLGQLRHAFQRYGGQVEDYKLHEPKTPRSLSTLERFFEIFSLSGTSVEQDNFQISGGNFLDDLNNRLTSAQPPEAIALLTNTNDLPQTLELLPVNHRRIPVVAGDSFLQRSTLQVGRDHAEDMVIAVPWGISQGCRFLEDSRNFWQGEVTWRTATSYDATQALISAIAFAQPTDPTVTWSSHQEATSLPSRIAVQQALHSPNLNAIGACGKSVLFEQNGNRQGSGQLMIVRPDTKVSVNASTPWTFELLNPDQ
jgi:branched-chain amino acid transport system substrate-binding protein